MRSIIFLLLFDIAFLLSCSSSSSNPPHLPSSTTEDPLVLTKANIRGHQTLYDEGWFIISSSKEAIEYAHRQSVVSSGQSLERLRQELSQRSSEYSDHLVETAQNSRETLQILHQSGQETTASIQQTSQEAGERQAAWGKQALTQAGSYIKGGLYYGKRTQEHWQELKNVWPQYYQNLKEDFSNIVEINQKVSDRFSTHIELDWELAFEKASQETRKEYEASGEEENAIAGLGTLLYGYLKGLYYGLVKPSAKSLVMVGEKGAQAGSYLFTPIAGTLMASGRTIQSTGLSLYYAGKTTVSVFSPTVEAGFLTGLGMLSIGSGQLTKVGGQTLGLANQVAFTTAGAAAGGAQAVAGSVAETGKYVAFVAYDIGKTTTNIAIHQAKSAVVLGYNALTAIPAHLIMGVPDAVILAYEGPRLVLITVRGQLSEDSGSSLANLPVGSVLDVEAMKAGGVTIETLTDDPQIIQQVLEKIPADLKESP